jgi:hypothetical protein
VDGVGHARPYEEKPKWFSLIAGRFARGYAHSGIYYD